MRIEELLERNIVPVRSELGQLPKEMSANPDIWTSIIKKVAPNIKVLGNGGYGMVVNLPGNKFVFKIWSQDKGYDAFIEFCRTHESIHLPRFRETNSLRSLRHGKKLEEDIAANLKLNNIEFRYAILERLTPISYDALAVKYLGEMIYLGYINILEDYEVDRFLKRMMSNGAIANLMHKFNCDNLWDLKRNNAAWAAVEHELNIPESWKTIASSLRKFKGLNDRFGWDIGSSNLMSRRGTLIITDPFAGGIS